MRRKLFAILVLSFVSFGLFAQVVKENKFEVGAGYAPIRWGDRSGGWNKLYDINAFFEWRHSGGHFEYGARLDYKIGPHSMDGLSHCIGALAVADFNILPGKAVNPYIGVYAGPAVGLSNTGEYFYGTDFIVNVGARLGVELFNHLRISGSFDLLPIDVIHPPLASQYMTAFINVGWVF